MRFGDFKATKDTNPAYKRFKELGLESHVFDIETYGFTVVPAEKVASRDFFERVRDTVYRHGARQSQVLSPAAPTRRRGHGGSDGGARKAR